PCPRPPGVARLLRLSHRLRAARPVRADLRLDVLQLPAILRRAEPADDAVRHGRRAAAERQRDDDPPAAAPDGRRRAVLPADAHDAVVCRGEAQRHHRAAADLPAHRLGDRARQVPGRPVALRRDARRDGAQLPLALRVRQPGILADRRRLPRAAADGRQFPRHRAVHLEPDAQPARGRGPDLQRAADAAAHQLDRRRVGPGGERAHLGPRGVPALRGLLAWRDRHATRRLLPEFHRLRLVPGSPVGRRRPLARLARRHWRQRNVMKRVFDALGWVGVLLVVAAVVIRFVKPELETLWWRLAMGGLVVVLVYLASQWREFLAWWQHRSARAGTLSSVSVLLVLAILVGVNWIATRQHKRWDLTAARQFSISDQTRRVLDELEAPVNVKVFARDTDFQRFRDRLDAYTYVTDKLQVEYVDPDKQPALARQWEIQQYGTIAVEHAGRIERITTSTEQDITNAIVRAVQGGETKIYF